MRFARWWRTVRCRSAWLLYLIIGLVMSVAYVFGQFVDLVSGAIGLGAVAALVVGPRWHRARPLRPWNLLSLAAALFLMGVLVRPWAVTQDGLAAFAADACTVPGYLLMIWALLLLIRARGLERHAVVDGLIIGIGAGLLSFLQLAVPAASVEGRGLAVSILAAVYPLFDVVLLLILLNLAFTTAAPPDELPAPRRDDDRCSWWATSPTRSSGRRASCSPHH